MKKGREIRPRLPEHVAKMLEDTFWSMNGGARYLLTCFTMTYKRRLESLKRSFNQRELLLIVDAFKNVDKLPEHIPPDRFLMDTIKYQIDENRYAQKWGVDPKDFLQSLEYLTYHQDTLITLSIWAWAATHGNHGMSKYDYVRELSE